MKTTTSRTAAMKLSEITSNTQLVAALATAGMHSIPQISLLDSVATAARLPGRLTQAQESALAQLRTRARRLLTRAADQAVLQMQAQSAGGNWLGNQVKLPTVPSRPDGLKLPCHCGCCDSIFSLKAYLFDLLDLLAHTWRIDLHTVERLLLRSFDKVTAYDPDSFIGRRVDLDCDALNTPMPQAAIACEVLEVHLQSLGRQVGAAWPKLFVDGLLRLVLPREIVAAVVEANPPSPGSTQRLTVAQVRSLPGLPAAFDAALTLWATELGTLIPDLAGIVRAYGLLEDNRAGMLGHEPGAGFAQDRESTLRHWLTGYRDALRAASGATVDVLEASTFLSLDAGACRTTTRLQELVTSVQQIVESVRSGEIARVRRPDLPAALLAILQQAAVLPLAESAWTRLRDFETWLGFMYGWVYPENVLSPLMANTAESRAFKDVPQALVAEPLTDSLTRKIYLGAVTRGPGSVLQQEREAVERAIGGSELRTWKQAADAVRQKILDFTSDEPDLYLGSEFEKDLWFPLAAGLLLNRNQQYAAAHAWYRLLFDPQALRPSAIFATIGTPGHERAGDSWLDDAFDPVSIANRRPGTWLRHAVLAMVRNLIDWADDEFARGLPDTVQRAEELYELARRTLQAPPLQSECELVLLDVVNVISDALKLPGPAAHRMAQPLAQVRDPDVLARTQTQISAALRGKGSAAQKQRSVERLLSAAVRADRRGHPERSLSREYAQQQSLAAQNEDAAFRTFSFGLVTGGLAGGGGGAVQPPDHPFDEPPVQGPPLDTGSPAPTARFFCIPRNPVLHSLQLHIDNQLEKLRLCLDFLGEPQPARVYGCDTYDAATGTINRPAADAAYSGAIAQPRYRYNFLVDKARQYVDVAQRIGALLLQALQNRDSEAFAQLKARHAIELADATTVLRRLGQREAEHGVDIARLQQSRATAQLDQLKAKIGDPDDLSDDLSDNEKKALQALESSVRIAQVGVAISTLAIPAAALGAVATATGPGAVVGVPLIIAAGVAAAGGALLSIGAHGSAQANLAQTQASLDRRSEDWLNQFELAGFDQRIARVQVTLANDRLRLAGQELQIAQLQLAHAREELRFLQSKITDAALYDWMVRVLSRDYRALMQIAACVAKMAQRALEFERQEAVQFISGDYWNIAQGVLKAPALTEQQRSLGLLGAERLLTDLTRLDAYKLTTERRRLQLTKTFSLARMMPTEMVQFRDTGTITFNTLFDWFDEGFQGHFLRLIKSVRVSILAIVPPIDGIHAMLHNTGESSVVVPAGGAFVAKRTARNFGESIALDAAVNESGLFVLNHDDPMLLPFEGLGVQTQWTLELPPGNNRFDFGTIADVFLTIEYTAEYSRAYEQQMRDARRGTLAHEDTALPLRMMFPDQWYHLKNHRADASGAFQPFALRFATTSGMFSPNLRNLAVTHLTLLVSGDFSEPQDQQALEAGIAITMDTGRILHSSAAPAFGPGLFDGKSLLLSTRGAGATGLGAQPVVGATDGWTVEFAQAFYTAAAGRAPLIERLTDVLLVITVTGLRA